MAVIMDGKALAAEYNALTKKHVAELKVQGVNCKLCVVQVGDDPASNIYIRNKKNACESVGIICDVIKFDKSATEEEVKSTIAKLGIDADVSSILVQLPLPENLNDKYVCDTIPLFKDVDGFKEYHLGSLMKSKAIFEPCTPKGIMCLLEKYNIPIAGKYCVVIGRSNTVGNPLSQLLLHADGTVTICHSKTKNLKKICKTADILVSAVGKRNLVTADMVRDGAVVIDVGTNRDENGKLCGDVDFKNVEPKASYITPVPGGVGPMTVAMLLQNTMNAAYIQHNFGV